MLLRKVVISAGFVIIRRHSWICLVKVPRVSQAEGDWSGPSGSDKFQNSLPTAAFLGASSDLWCRMHLSLFVDVLFWKSEMVPCKWVTNMKN